MTAKVQSSKFKVQSSKSCHSSLVTLFTAYCLLLTAYCFAEEQTIITSETLEYCKETSTYTAKGDVKIQRGDVVIESTEVTYNEQTSEVVAAGDVRYSDPDTSVTAGIAEFNLETKTGKLCNAEIFYKKDNYYISGEEFEKRGEKYYFSPEAIFTTCDAPVPEWCFKGRNVNIVIGDKVTARDVFFHIKALPILYTPYLWTPILTERKTGFLIPSIGYSESKGVHFNTPFFWAISENRDATVVLDIYSERGVGGGLEYRYVEPQNVRGNWWLYHIRDSKLNKDFNELRVLHNSRYKNRLGGFLNLNLVNEKDFYQEFSPYIEVRSNRFLESSGEISLPLTNSRLYLLSQYWIDLKDNTGLVPQRLPELGYVLNFTEVGQFWVSAIATASNFWKDAGVSGQRIDIYNRLLHTSGRDIVVTQGLGIRETAYSLHRDEDVDSSLHRETLDYSITAHARLIRKYTSITHILEPSLSYIFITDSESGMPVFDSTELFRKMSKIELTLLNRLLGHSMESLVVRVSQGFNSYNGDRPFLPLRLEIGVKKPLSVRLDTTYDVHEGKLEGINSDMTVDIAKASISFGQRYNRHEDIMFYRTGIEFSPYKSLKMEGRLWYDAKGGGVRDTILNLKYLSQCWGVKLEFVKRPHDFMTMVKFELRGLGFKKV
ncbi:MAG: LPS assembly protein LptD [Nitrospirota bacterium]